MGLPASLGWVWTLGEWLVWVGLIALDIGIVRWPMHGNLDVTFIRVFWEVSDKTLTKLRQNFDNTLTKPS